MAKQTKIIYGLLAVSAVLGNCAVGQAAEDISEQMIAGQILADSGAASPKQAIDNPNTAHNKDKNKSKTVKAPAPPAPVTIEGDQLSYNDTTGNVSAKGSVKITQLPINVLADEVRGNTKRTEIKIDGKANITQPGMNLDGYATFYNYQARTGNMANAQGIVDYEKHVQGERIEFFPDEYIVYRGTETKCPAQKPCNELRAKKIEIWPDDKLIAYDAQFLINGKVIYSTPRYETKLGKHDSSPFPRIGYNSDNGFYIKQSFQMPVANSVTAEATIGYYSKHDFKNEYQIVKNDPNYTLAVMAGSYQDDNNNWVKKQPELEFTYATKRIAGGPWRYDFKGIYGKWTDDYKSSWHQDYTVYFSRDAIKLSKSLSLTLGTGYEVVKESFDDSQINTMKYDTVLYKTVNSKLSLYTGYHYTKNNNQNSLFDYNSSTVGQELASGFTYRFDRKNSLSVSQSYDLANKRLADMYYTWDHRVCCWNVSLTYHKDYDGNDSKVKATVSLARW